MNRLRMLRLAMRRKAPSPLGALARGLIAGAIGAGAQSLLMKEEGKPPLASGIHYLFGALWGGLYGLVRESFQMPVPLFGALVWTAGLPRGLATAGAYAVLRDLGPIPLRAVPGLIALQAWAFFLRSPPARLLQRRQSWPRRFLYGTLVQKAALA